MAHRDRLTPEEMHQISMRLFHLTGKSPLTEVEADLERVFDHARSLEAEIRDRDYADAVKTFVGMTVHYCNDSDMPSIHIACLGWGRPNFRDKDWPKPPHKEVFRFEDAGHLFAHDLRLVTCNRCKEVNAFPVVLIEVKSGDGDWHEPEEDESQWRKDSAWTKKFIDLGFPYAPGTRPTNSDDGYRIYFHVIPGGRDVKAALKELDSVRGVLSVSLRSRSE